MQYSKTSNRNFLENIKERLNRKKLNQLNSKWNLMFQNNSVLIENDHCNSINGMIEKWTFKISEIDIIKVFKTDDLVYDTIWINIEIGDTVISIPDEMDNWEQSIEELQSRLSRCLPFENWYQKIVHPAFKRNEIIIYIKNNHC